MILSGLGEDPG